MVKPTVKRQRLSPEDRRAQLLSFAVSAYARTGVERAGHGDVAKLAGVSTATVFNYFPTREALTQAVFSRIRDRIEQLFIGLPPTTTSAGDQVRVMATAFDLLLGNEPDLIKVFLNWSVAFGPDVRPQFLEFQDHILTEITKHLPDGQDDRSDARIIMGAADMLALMKLDETDPDTIQRFVDRLADALD